MIHLFTAEDGNDLTRNTKPGGHMDFIHKGPQLINYHSGEVHLLHSCLHFPQHLKDHEDEPDYSNTGFTVCLVDG